MTTAQIKMEIQRALDAVPESALPDILHFLKELQTAPEEQIKLAHNLRRILAEDKELLQKLAQ